MRNVAILEAAEGIKEKIEWRGYGYPMNKCVLVTGSTGMMVVHFVQN